MAEQYSVEEFIQASKSVEASAGILAVLRGVLHPAMAAYLPEANQANRVARFVSEFLDDPNRASRAEILEPFQDRLTAAADAIVRLDGEQYPNAHKAAMEFEEKILNMIQIAAGYQIFLIANTLGVPCPPFSEDDVVHHWPKVRALIEKYPAVDEQGLRATIARERANVLRALSTGEEANPWLSSKQLAERYGVTSDSAKGKTERWRKAHAVDRKDLWMEAESPGPRQPRYLYRLSAVRHLFEK
ncbi:MAG: hypothetical protein C0485_16560 [Pirellula sp.]|nr:hypothetical protein [Pirellula sp.]